MWRDGWNDLLPSADHEMYKEFHAWTTSWRKFFSPGNSCREPSENSHCLYGRRRVPVTESLPDDGRLAILRSESPGCGSSARFAVRPVVSIECRESATP